MNTREIGIDVPAQPEEKAIVLDRYGTVWQRHGQRADCWYCASDAYSGPLHWTSLLLSRGPVAVLRGDVA